jgi:hypothetical protein
MSAHVSTEGSVRLLANADTTSLAGISVLIADTPITVGVCPKKSEGRTTKNFMALIAFQGDG